MHFTKGSQALKLKTGEYVRVIDADPGTNLVTVKTANGRMLSTFPAGFKG